MTKIIPAYENENAYNRWHYSIYELENSIIGLPVPEKSECLDIFHTYGHSKFHAQQC